MTTSPETEDEQTASATRAPVEVPGADGDHVLANVLNAAIDWDTANARLAHDGSMIATVDALRAGYTLRENIRTYREQVNA